MKDSKNDKTKVINVKDKASDKTSMFFEVGDKEKKIDSGFYKDSTSFEKTIHETDFDLKKLFPDRTKSGHVKINRNFLKDAEPFSLERLKQDTKNISKGIFTGFNNIDILGSITSYEPMVFYGLPRKEIVLILLNILVNMVENYPKCHFLYYTYSEFRVDMEFKLINILSEKAFEKKHNMNGNLKQWIEEIGSIELEPLIEEVKNNKKYSGLKKYISFADRIHIIDSNYNFDDLRDSIKSFSKVFDLGAVIIDNAEEININNNSYNTELPRIKYISNMIRRLSLELNYPFFYGYSSIDGIKKESLSNINFINYSTRVMKVRKEYPNLSLIDNNSGKEFILNIDYDLLRMSET